MNSNATRWVDYPAHYHNNAGGRTLADGHAVIKVGRSANLSANPQGRQYPDLVSSPKNADIPATAPPAPPGLPSGRRSQRKTDSFRPANCAHPRRHCSSVRLLSIFSIWWTGAVAFAAESSLKLTKDDVVVFLGGTDMVRAQRSGHLETLPREPSNDLPNFDMSWEGDTVFALENQIHRWRSGGFRGIMLGTETAGHRKGHVVIVQLAKTRRSPVSRESRNSSREATNCSVGCGEDRHPIVLSPSPFEEADDPLTRPRNAMIFGAM